MRVLGLSPCSFQPTVKELCTPPRPWLGTQSLSPTSAHSTFARVSMAPPKTGPKMKDPSADSGLENINTEYISELTVFLATIQGLEVFKPLLVQPTEATHLNSM